MISLVREVSVSEMLTLEVSATSTPANYFQDGRAGIQMSTWHGSAIPVDILWANVITRPSMSPALCWVQSAHCSTYEDKLRRPQFCRSRASRVEQSSSQSPSAEHCKG